MAEGRRHDHHTVASAMPLAGAAGASPVDLPCDRIIERATLPIARTVTATLLRCGRMPWGFQNLAPVLFFGKAPDLHLGSKATTIRSSDAAEKNGHPCPKPIKWMTWLIDLCSRPGETVLDPFAGSGTTLRAAKDLGRRAIGIEVNEAYCQIAVSQLAQGVLWRQNK